MLFTEMSAMVEIITERTVVPQDIFMSDAEAISPSIITNP